MDQDKSFIFNRVELAILILFFLVMSATSFVLGIRFGKKFTLANSTTSQSSIITTNSKESSSDSISNIASASQRSESQRSETDKKQAPEYVTTILGEKLNKLKIDDETYKDIQKKIAELETKEKAQKNIDSIKKSLQASKNEPETFTDEDVEMAKNSNIDEIEQRSKSIEEELAQVVADVETEVDQDTLNNIKSTIDNEIIKADESLMGKYTIQVGAFKTSFEARDFADSFVARSYRPIINEVDLGIKGTWYRVGLGLFDTEASAKKYLTREASLFEGQQAYINIIE